MMYCEGFLPGSHQPKVLKHQTFWQLTAAIIISLLPSSVVSKPLVGDKKTLRDATKPDKLLQHDVLCCENIGILEDVATYIL